MTPDTTPTCLRKLADRFEGAINVSILSGGLLKEADVNSAICIFRAVADKMEAQQATDAEREELAKWLQDMCDRALFNKDITIKYKRIAALLRAPAVTVDDAFMAALLVQLTARGITPDIQELLVHGNPDRGVAPRSLEKAILALLGREK